MRTIALLTDFGIRDIYVGVMKAVMTSIYPEVNLIDLSHYISAQNVRSGAFALLNAYAYFPKGTVFLVVIDPGVGSLRQPVAIRCEDYFFVAPDNGVLSYVLENYPTAEIVRIENPALQLPHKSNTFHGRDVFAPVAAHLAKDPAIFFDLGQPLDQWVTLPKPLLTIQQNRILGEVIHTDHFGNVITSIYHFRWLASDQLKLELRWEQTPGTYTFDASEAIIKFADKELAGIHRAYHEVQRGDLMCQIDSNGFLEIAINQGNAQAYLDIKTGDRIELILPY
ncbi:hypothetical protein MASR2M15_14470 [Anaerolineales bacterium]